MGIVSRVSIGIVGLALIGVGTGLWLTRPQRIDPSRMAGFVADPKNGARMFALAGCASCHTAPKAEAKERPELGGGRAFPTPFGTFHAPNISPDRRTGIGDWTVSEIVDAFVAGVGRDGRHEYPALPYGSYARMTLADAYDLAAFLKTLPPVENEVPPHDLAFPWNVRIGLGVWKLLYLDRRPVVDLPNASPELLRGRYLVEGPGHCGECHTPRDPLGGPDRSRWLAGAPLVDGPGRVPDLTPDPKALGGWSVDDIASYLESGFTPEGDVVGGPMADVVANWAKASPEDRRAVALYLKAIPPVAPEPKPAAK